MFSHFLASTATDSSQLLQPFLEKLIPWLYFDSIWWTATGIVGQTVFGARFLVQWLFTEAKGQVVVPASFWHLSFWGGLVNFFYVLHLDKLPLILGSFFLPVIYGRNLWLYYHPKPQADLKPESESEPTFPASS